MQSALDIKYPPEKLTVYVCDDGRSDPVKQELQVKLQHPKCPKALLSWITLAVQESIDILVDIQICEQIWEISSAVQAYILMQESIHIALDRLKVSSTLQDLYLGTYKASQLLL